METFVVPYVKADQIGLWHEFWDQKPSSPRSIKVSKDGSLGLTAMVAARNKDDAAEQVRKQHPGFTVITSAIS